jgi:hypothetical protein
VLVLAGYVMLGFALPVLLLAQKPRWRCGWLVRLGSAWIGAHWSPRNRRLCVNFIPCVTLWIAWPGGKTPEEG